MNNEGYGEYRLLLSLVAVYADLDFGLPRLKSFNSQVVVSERGKRRISDSELGADEVSDAQVCAVTHQVATVRRVRHAERRVDLDQRRLVLGPTASTAATTTTIAAW